MEDAFHKRMEEEFVRFQQGNGRVNVRRLDVPGGEGDGLYNLASSDSLGLASDQAVMETFFQSFTGDVKPDDSDLPPMTTDAEECRLLEQKIRTLYGMEAALVFGSAYHANTGIVPVIAKGGAEVFADQRIHSTLLDSICLSAAKHHLYPHNDLNALREMLDAAVAEDPHATKIIVTESLFAETGDFSDLPALVALKREHPNVLLYVDEAEALGTCGPTGLGYAEETGTLPDIDLIVGAFGKALASTGAFVATNGRVPGDSVRDMRALIASLALPPISLRWTQFVIEQAAVFRERRQCLRQYGLKVAGAVRASGRPCLSASHLVCMPFRSGAEAIACSKTLMDAGFYAPPHQLSHDPGYGSCIRFSLTAVATESTIDRVVNVIKRL